MTSLDDLTLEQLRVAAVRARAFELSLGPDAGGSPEEDWLRAERELSVAHEYDTADRDFEELGITLSRLPSEAGAVWRLTLPRGERFEAWEPGNGGLAPPAEIGRLVERVAMGKPLVPSPPASADPGARRLRELLEEQRRSLLAHDPGVRLGVDSENLHQHRVAARRVQAYLRAARAYLDPAWRRMLLDSLRELAAATGPVRDLDVLLAHVSEQVRTLDEPDRAAAVELVAALEGTLARTRQQLGRTLDGRPYSLLLSRLRLPPALVAAGVEVPLKRLARKEFRSLAAAAERLGKHPNETEIHALRILLKHARYAAELAGAGGAQRKRFLDDAKALQDLLGEHQDALVAEKRLRETTVVDDSTAVAFVAGRIAERQRTRRAAVRERLPGAWRRLRKSGRRIDHS